jgi:immunoglobulin-binding protein 1
MDQNIRSLFAAAENDRIRIESSRDPNSVTYRENIATAIANYEESRVLADRLSLFSVNETLEDIATGDLQ